MAEWISVCRVDQLVDGRGQSLDAAGMRIAVFRTGDGVVALPDAVLTRAGHWAMVGSTTEKWCARSTNGGSS